MSCHIDNVVSAAHHKHITHCIDVARIATVIITLETLQVTGEVSLFSLKVVVSVVRRGEVNNTRYICGAINYRFAFHY
jgi:hypothetical protein